MIKSFHLNIINYNNAAMEDSDEATAKLLEEVVKNIRAFGLHCDHIPTTIRDDNGNKVGDISIFIED